MNSRKEKELKDIIEQQKEQLGRYEKKLRGIILFIEICTRKVNIVTTDVVHAYKGIIKEKEALEASLKALTKISPDDEDDSNYQVVNITAESQTEDGAENEGNV